MRKIILGAILVVAAFFAVELWALNTFWPGGGDESKPVLTALPPLPPAARSSVVAAPVAIALPAIRTALDNAAPRNFAGKNDNPGSDLLSKADIGITIARGPIAVAGRPEGLTITAPLTGSVHVAGQLAGKAAGTLGGAIGNLLGSGALGKQMETFVSKPFDQTAEIRGNVVMTARPALTPTWRLDPNLSAQVNLGDTALSIAGVRINVASESRPLIDRQVNEQVAALQARLRNDPTIEQAARRQWAKMCRSIPLGGGATGLPSLWLELKPTRAFAAQPRIDASAVTLTVGVQADTRIGPAATKPNCPFPAQLELVPQTEQGRLAISVSIDVPFAEVNKLMEAQLKGRKFPEDGSGPAEVEVLRASVAASGDRLLISLRVKAREKKSWFGFGAEATIHVWGKPALDREQQIMRLTDIALAIESEAAFGPLGAAAQAAVPYLQDALAQNAVVDLKPFTADARAKIDAAIAEFRQAGEGVRVEAAVRDIRLTGIEFDSNTLRVIAEATGEVKVAVTQLPAL